MDIRDNLRSYIEDKSIHKSAIAKKANINYILFMRSLNKNRRLEANEFLKICDALDITVENIKNYHN